MNFDRLTYALRVATNANDGKKWGTAGGIMQISAIATKNDDFFVQRKSVEKSDRKSVVASQVTDIPRRAYNEAGGDGMNYSELRQKDVINVCDGRRLGRPIDLILNDNACIAALVIPEIDKPGLWGMLRPEREGHIVPWRSVRQIGDDVILVEIDYDSFNSERK